MSEDTGAVLATILDGMTAIQEQIQGLHRRLDAIDAALAGAADIEPTLELILKRLVEDRSAVQADLATVAEIAVFAHAAASGAPAPLPTPVMANPLLDRYLLRQPANHSADDRACATWRDEAPKLSSNELMAVLTRQQHPSATDTDATRLLRYRLAAISREELEKRKAPVPTAPVSSIAPDRSPRAQAMRSRELARLWRKGSSADLFAEAELVATVDLFADAMRRAETAEQDAPEMVDLHRAIGDALEAGDRPSLKGKD